MELGSGFIAFLIPVMDMELLLSKSRLMDGLIAIEIVLYKSAIGQDCSMLRILKLKKIRSQPTRCKNLFIGPAVLQGRSGDPWGHSGALGPLLVALGPIGPKVSRAPWPKAPVTVV